MERPWVGLEEKQVKELAPGEQRESWRRGRAVSSNRVQEAMLNMLGSSGHPKESEPSQPNVWYRPDPALATPTTGPLETVAGQTGALNSHQPQEMMGKHPALLVT